MEQKVTLNKVLSAQFLKEEINNLFENGMPTGFTLGLKVDNLFRLDTSMLNVITGVPNYGKSEFLDFTCVRLNKQYGLKTLYYSPENFPVKRHLAKLLSKLTNKSFNNLTKEEIDANIDYISDNFFFLNYETVNTLDDILNEAEQLIVSNNIKILNIDPYNTLEDQRPANLTETEYVSQVMTRLQKFAKKNDILINLVVHPKKLQTDVNGYTVMPNRYDLNGSANFANKADYIVIVHRDFINNTTIIKCDKCKFSNYGQIGECEIQYDTISTNYFDTTNTASNSNTHDEEMYATAMQVLELHKCKEQQKQKNVLDVSVSYFDNVFNKKGTTINLYEYLIDKDKKYYNKYSAIVDSIRNAKTDEQRKELKKNSNLACITVSCETGDDKSDIKEVNNIICIDIDKQDNLTIIDRVPSLVKQFNCVAYFAKSVSGTGYYCLIPIKYTDMFKLHFNALQKDFAERGITIDKSCSNLNRLRYYSYDNDAYINTNAEVYTTLLEDKRETTTTDNRELKAIKINDKQIVDMLDYINNNKLDITNTYQRWLSVTAAIANTYSEAGRALYHNICKYHKAYNVYECDDKYNDLLVNSLSDFGIGTLFYIYKECKAEYEAMNKQA